MGLLEAAENLLKTLDTVTTEDFSLGGEREAREALRKAIEETPSPRIVIEMEGGLIQEITANMKGEVLVLDADTEGGDEDRISGRSPIGMEARKKFTQEASRNRRSFPNTWTSILTNLPRRSKVTDFSHARTVRCHVCGTRFCDVEGRLCDCRQCEGCGEWFTDPLDLADGLCEACRPHEREDDDDEQKDFTHACQGERTL